MSYSYNNTFNRFYVYVEVFSEVYEPAEGGYYVTVSTIIDDYTFMSNCADSALDEFKRLVKLAIDEGDKPNFKFNFDDNDEPFISLEPNEVSRLDLRTPYVMFNDNRLRVGICCHEPEPIVYNGYC